MTAALFDVADVPPLVPRELAGPWRTVAEVVGIDASAVDVGYERAHLGYRARRGSTGRDLRTGRLSVLVRPNLIGDELLGVLLHEAVHVRVHQTRPPAECLSHGTAFRAELDEVCARLGVHRPSAYYCWPDRREQAAVAVALKGAR